MVDAEEKWGAILVDRSSVAALTFLLWDILITLDDEVRYIWLKPHRYWTKWLFLFIRYFALAIQISILFVGTELASHLGYTPYDCVVWYIWQEVSTEVLIACVEVVLIVRIQALYNRKRLITILLYILFVFENVVMIVTLVRVVPDVRFDSACVVVHSPAQLLYFAVSFIAFETLLFLLMLVKFVQAVRSGWGDTPVLSVLVRDGTWVFAVVFATLCINAGFYLGANGSLAAVAYGWIISVESFAGCRLILNMQSLEDPASDDEEEGRGVVSSRIEFTSNLGMGSHVEDGDRLRAHVALGRRGCGHGHQGRGRRTRRGMGMGMGMDEEGAAFEMTVTDSSGSGSGSRGTGTGTMSWADALEIPDSRGIV